TTPSSSRATIPVGSSNPPPASHGSQRRSSLSLNAPAPEEPVGPLILERRLEHEGDTGSPVRHHEVGEHEGTNATGLRVGELRPDHLATRARLQTPIFGVNALP